MSTIAPPASAQATHESDTRQAGAPASTPASAPALPGLPPGPRLPVTAQTILVWNRSVPFLKLCQRLYGPVFTIRAMPWGRAVVINDSALVKQIFTGDPAVYHAGDGNSLLAPVLGERSVLVLDEDTHLQARKRLLPPFHGDSVRRYGEVVERIVSEEIARWPLGEPFSLHPRMRAITLEVILQAVIGLTDGERARALRKVLPSTVEIGPTIMAMWVYESLERFGP